MSDEVPGRSDVDTAASSWQYPFDFSAALTIEPDPAQSGFVTRPERIFAAATPAWGLSQADVAAARSFVSTRPTTGKATGPGGTAPSGKPPEGKPGAASLGSTGTALPPWRSTSSVTAVPAPAPAHTPPSLPADALAGAADAVTEAHRAQAHTAEADEGVAEAFVEVLRHSVVPPVPGFRVLRLVPPPEASGERPLGRESSKDSVVVGERVVVTWIREVQDADHAAPRVMSHLDAVDFFGVPETYGILLWQAPSGREVPVAWATKYLPRARDGWDWCVDLCQRALGLDGGGPPDPWVADFPARIGRHVAKLHIALATPSKVLSEPTATASADLVHAWHAVAGQTVDQAESVARRDLLDGASDLLLPRIPLLRAAVDGLLAVADDVETGGCSVTVQPVHGDLHVGQVLRWPAGLAVVDFHPDPALEFKDLRVGQPQQPAARDLARLLRSLDHVGRVVDKLSGFTATHAVDRWSQDSRASLLAAYKAELAAAGRPELLDERLLLPFEVEQLCRELVYAGEHLPSWAYAPLGGLWQEFPTAPESAAVSGRRGRHSADPSS